MQEPHLNMTKDDKLVLLQEPYKHGILKMPFTICVPFRITVHDNESKVILHL